MEDISYPLAFGIFVRNERKRRNMNQEEFYNFLFPENDKTPENIKKKMNAIENGKQQSVDFAILEALCEKCDVSADYILGKDPYSNHDVKFVCDYTGLEKNAVQQLHHWRVAKDNGADNLHMDGIYSGPDAEKQFNCAREKESAIRFLKIINYLFKEGYPSRRSKNKNQTPEYSNLSIINSIYLMCMAEPVKLEGHILKDRPEYLSLEKWFPDFKSFAERIAMDPKQVMMMQDNSAVWYPVDLKSLLEQYAMNQLEKDLHRMIEQIRKDSSSSNKT